MKRLLDIPIVCVSAVLTVALLRTPTAAPPSVDDHVMNRPAASPAVDGERDQAAGRRHASAAQSTEAEKGSETADRSV